MMSISTNVQSLNAQRNLSATRNSLSKNFEKLSSGLRINRAGDDAAGLGISEKMKSDIRSFRQAERNASDGISLVQTFEGAMNEISGMLIRMKEIATQSANGTYTDATDRSYLQAEFTELSSEIDRIAGDVEFNGVALNNVAAGFALTVGSDSTDTITVATGLDVTVTGLNGGAFTGIATAANAGTTMGEIDTALDALNNDRSTLGASQNRLEATISNLQSMRENISAANSRIRDVDVAEETAAMTRNNILQQAGVSMLAQANQLPSLALSLLG